MTPKKPDRWERVVEDLEFIRDCGGKETPVCESAEVLKLLRKEHAAVVRMVRDLRNYYLTLCDSKACKHRVKAEACELILDQLKRRAK